MKTNVRRLDHLDFAAAARKATSHALTQVPHLISERALAGRPGLLAGAALTAESAGMLPAVETIGMPKHHFGSRPIALMAPESRVTYEALVQALEPDLPRSSRGDFIDAHLSFGKDKVEEERHKFFVDFDITACYEYVRHDILREELLIQSHDHWAVELLMNFLSGLYPSGNGLPQANPPSHSLADAYLNRLERGLARHGYEIHRYADDFRLICGSESEAAEALEYAVEYARRDGLVLADGKIKLRSIQELQGEFQDLEHERQAYMGSMWGLRPGQRLVVAYDDFAIIDDDEDLSGAIDLESELVREEFETWARGEPSDARTTSTLRGARGCLALTLMQKEPLRLNDEDLIRLVRREPTRLYHVASYLSARNESDQNWATLQTLTEFPRQSAWMRLWLLHLGETIDGSSRNYPADFASWARSCLGDRHETVRAEAAWVLARTGELSREDVNSLYMSSGKVTHAGLSAAVGASEMQGLEAPSGWSNAFRNATKLSKVAFDWGKENA